MKVLGSIVLGGMVLAVGHGAIAQGRQMADVGGHRHGGGDSPMTQVAPPAAMGARGEGRGMGRDWTQHPTLVPVMRSGERERGATLLKAQNIAAAQLDVFAPDASVPDARRQFPTSDEGTRVTMLPKVGNFYWVSARAEQEGRVVVASTVAYFSEPGPAPTSLFKTPKYELEIVPQPHPREHSSYRESEKWKFALRLNGQPLANKPVKMETEFGTRTTFYSDVNGIVTVLFPRDVKPAEPARDGAQHTMGPRRAKFVLAAEAESNGTKYLTAYNDTYSPDPDRVRSLGWGAAFGLVGMAAAVPLLRRRSGVAGQGEKHA